MRSVLAMPVLMLGLLLAACGSAPSGAGSASAGTAAPPGVTLSGAGGPAGCGARVLVTAIRREHACVRRGATLRVRSSHRAPGRPYLQNWTPVVSSNPRVIACRSTSYPNGSVAAACRALRAGTATLTSALVYAGGGPPQGPHPPRWRAAVTVRP